jgi:hypothetical protein
MGVLKLLSVGMAFSHAARFKNEKGMVLIHPIPFLSLALNRGD